MPVSVSRIQVTSDSVLLDGTPLAVEGAGRGLLSFLYRRYIGDYPKFFKMDALCRLGLVASELLLQAETGRAKSYGSCDHLERFVPREDRAVLLFNRSGSLCDDCHYQATIQETDNYFPSPSVFVYTLPNIVTGEIAIRNKYLGETSFYVLESRDDRHMARIIDEAFMDRATHSVLGGWLECTSDDSFEADLSLWLPDTGRHVVSR